MRLTDDKGNFTLSTSLAPAARTATANGTGVDTANHGVANVEFIVGTITDGTHTPKIQESADNSAWSDVAAGDLVGSLAALASNVNQKVSYIGTKRYIRAVSTVTGGPATGGVYAAVVNLRGARKHPQS